MVQIVEYQVVAEKYFAFETLALVVRFSFQDRPLSSVPVLTSTNRYSVPSCDRSFIVVQTRPD